MYIPRHFALEDRETVFAVMRRHDFALLVTAPAGRIAATPLPFVLDESTGPNGTLIAHMARANPQWRDFAMLAEAGQQALVVFQGVHAYVSPSWYGDIPAAVPTWNYVAVQARGLPRVVEEEAEVMALLERLVTAQEAGRDRPWTMASQAPDYLERMRRGIVAFEIPIESLEAKAKMSQDKPEAVRRGAREGLGAEADPLARETARFMAGLEGGPA